MMQLTIAVYTVEVTESPPEHDGASCVRGTRVERFGGELGDWAEGYLHIEVRRGSGWPLLCVGQHYCPGRWAGSYPGLLLVPESSALFVGAGERLLAYDLRVPARLWEDRVDTGFHAW